MTTSFHPLGDLPADVRAFWERAGRGQDPAGYFTGSPEWVALMAGDGPDAGTVAALRGLDGHCRAVLPMLPRPWSLEGRILGRRFFRRTLQTFKVGGGDLIAEGADAALLAEGLRTILQQRPDVDAIWFEHLGAEARRQLLMQAARQSGAAFAVELYRGLPHYRLNLENAPPDPGALRSPKSLNRLRAKARALARETGEPCRMVEVRTPADWEPYAERIERLMNQSWQAQLLGHDFHLDSFRGTAERGWLHGFLLLAGEEALAFTLYFHGMGTMVSAVLGYDQRYAKFSPGAILFQHTLESIWPADRPRCLDFGEGDADYKRQWANDEIQVSALLLVRRSARWRWCFAWYRATRAADRTVRELLRLLRLDRFLVRRAKRATAATDAPAD